MLGNICDIEFWARSSNFYMWSQNDLEIAILGPDWATLIMLLVHTDIYHMSIDYNMTVRFYMTILVGKIAFQI